MHQEIVTLRQTQKAGVRHGGWIASPISLSHVGSPRKSPTGRGFLPKNTNNCTKPRESARSSQSKRAIDGSRSDYTITRLCVFAVKHGSAGLTKLGDFSDVTIVYDEELGKTILEIEVRGKRGVGYCKSMPGAVRPFERLKARLRPTRLDAAPGTQKPPDNGAMPGER